MDKKVYENIPVVPLRGLVVLPCEMLHFDAGREKSVQALQSAVERDGLIFLSAQKDARQNEVSYDDVYAIGTLCRVKQVLCLPNESTRVLVEGLYRARILGRVATEPYMIVDVEALEDEPCDAAEGEALRRRIGKSFSEYLNYTSKLAREALSVINTKEEPGAYADGVANIVLSKPEERQQVLEALDVSKRMKLVLKFIHRELEVKKADRRIADEVKKQIEKNQHEYYLNEQMKAIRKELGNDNESEVERYRARLAEKKLPDEVRERITKEIGRLESLPQSAHEGPVIRNYIECLLDLPWEERTEDNFSIADARRILDEDHYGLEEVKKRILEFIAVGKLKGSLNGQIICFVGPPGVGKTSISSSIAKSLGRQFVRMSLGGIKDEAEIRGHRRTYIGAMPGRIIAAMRQAGYVNPVLLFDEIDKLSNDFHGDPASAMLEVLDSAQNFAFRDHFLELPYDLSKVLFITTANTRDTIPAPLLDRMEIIEVPSYLATEKVEIAKRHLLPRQREKHGLTKGQLVVPDALLPEIIEAYTAEAGVRGLERELARICRKAACEVVEGKSRVRLSEQRLVEYLGKPRNRRRPAEMEDAVGMVNGLAWTAVGGEILTVEAQAVKGGGAVQATGKLGEVMQESAKAALTFVRAHAEMLNIPERFFNEHDIHVHVPAGAVPKDGPSAGITIMTAIASVIMGLPVHAGLAMTGEITLRGRVLPIGGLREKLLAAIRAGIHTVIVPAENRQDVEAEDMPAEIRDSLRILYVEDAMTVLRAALVHMPEPKVTPIGGISLRDLKPAGTGAVQ